MPKKSLNQILKSLTPVGRADSVYEVASAERINSIQEALQLITRGDHIVAGHNVRKKSGDGYVVINSGRSIGTGKGARSHHPWEVSIKNIEGTQSIAVRPGTINGVLPTNMFQTYPYSGFGRWYVVLTVFTDGRTVTSCLIEIQPNPPVPPLATLHMAPLYMQILLCLLVDKTPFQIVDTIIAVNPQETVKTLRETISPGEPYFDLNYTWQVVGTE